MILCNARTYLCRTCKQIGYKNWKNFKPYTQGTYFAFNLFLFTFILSSSCHIVSQLIFLSSFDACFLLFSSECIILFTIDFFFFYASFLVFSRFSSYEEHLYLSHYILCLILYPFLYLLPHLFLYLIPHIFLISSLTSSRFTLSILCNSNSRSFDFLIFILSFPSSDSNHWWCKESS